MTAPTLLLLPGLLCDEAVWADVRARLPVVSHCVVPVFGALASIDAMARLALAQAPSERFALAGHSMGGRVALEMMRLAPERIERLALLDTGVDPLAAGEAGQRERAIRLGLLDTAQRLGMRAMGREWARGMVHPAHIDSPLFDRILAMIERNTPAIFAAQITALLERPDARAVLATVNCPTLLACGRQDAWSPLVRHEQMHRLLPRARLVVIEDSGHMTPMEQPRRVADALLEWLNGR